MLWRTVGTKDLIEKLEISSMTHCSYYWTELYKQESYDGFWYSSERCVQKFSWQDRKLYCLLFCMGVKLGRSHWEGNFGWGCLRTGCWVEYSGLKRDEVIEEWRKLHNDELNDLYCSPNIVWVIKWRRMRWAGHVVRMVERRSIYWVLVGKTEEKRPLGRNRCRWEDNIMMDF